MRASWVTPFLDRRLRGRAPRRDGAVVAAGVAVAAAVLVLGSGRAAAHGLGSSQIRVQIEQAHLGGEWEISLADARKALGLDPALLGEAGWREIQGREAALRTQLGEQIGFTADGAVCPVAVTGPVQAPSGDGQILVRFTSDCPAIPVRLGLRCNLLFDLDPRHRVYFSVQDARVTHVGLFSVVQRSVTIDVRSQAFWRDFSEFVREGVRHIWSGLDHLLFLVALLLPAPLMATSAGWAPRPGLHAATREVVKVVSAFTVAHSLTLGLSFFGLLTLPSRWVEVAIAVSVFAAAWNNLRRFLPGRTWVMALGFGLVHGLGFAGALRNLSLPTHARALALAAFNVGVELGQLAIVAVVLPLLYAASRRRWYSRPFMGAGSLAIAWLAVLWILERGLGIALLSRL